MSEMTDFSKREDALGLLSEIGVTGLDRAAGYIYEEFLKSLYHDQGRKIYREMSSNDAVIGAMLYGIEMLIRPVNWTVAPFEEGDAKDEESAEFVNGVFGDMSHSWEDFIGEWMAAPVYGFAPFEIVWKMRHGFNTLPGLSSHHTDGKIGIRKLAIRHPDTLDKWMFDENGEVEALVQRAPPDWKIREIPISKLLLFTTLQRKGNPEGTSLLRRAYVAWYRKKKVEELEAIGIERELAGLPVAKVPSSWFLPDADSSSKALLASIKKIARRVRTDEQQALVLPMVLDENGNELLTFELMTTGGRRAIDIHPAKEYYSRQIAMSILADVILLGHEKVGSFALASSKTNLFAAGLNALLDDIQSTMQRHLIPRLLTLNGMDTTRPPQLQHGDIETPDLTVLGDYVSKLAGAGFPLFPTEDGELERELLRVANLPDEGVMLDAAKERMRVSDEMMLLPEDEEEEDDDEDDDGDE